MEKGENLAEELMEISITISRELGEAVAGYLIELGSPAVEEIPTGESVTLVAFYSRDGIQNKISSLGAFISQLVSSLEPHTKSPKIKVKKRAHKSWAEEIRKSFNPVHIAGDFWAMPTWTDIKKIPAGRIIQIDPGEAFGTGMHPTTRQAGRLLLEAISTKKIPSVLDVGTGSGILAILAKKAGAGRVVATDNDPRAVEVAMDNFRLNNCYIELSSYEIKEIKGKFDIIVANILLETLLDMAYHFKRLTKKGGKIILAGLLVEQGEEMRTKMRELGLKAPEKEVKEDKWLSMRYKL